MRRGILIARARTRARSLPVMVRPDRTIRSDTALTVPTVLVRPDRTIRSDSAFAGMVRSGRTRTAVGECAQNHQTAAAAITTEYTP